jgi:hypothetical protein
MKISVPILLGTLTQLQGSIEPDIVESTSSNPGLVIAAAVIVAIVIGGVILHTYANKTGRKTD